MAKKADYPVFEPFNPLDKRHLGASVANALLESDIYRLPPEPFIGAGVYALYYVGDFPAYEVLAEVNRNNQFACPIYVGKAVPDGARKGGQGDPEPLFTSGSMTMQNLWTPPRTFALKTSIASSCPSMIFGFR